MNSGHRIPAWITWISGVVLSAISVGAIIMTYMFTHFQTVEASQREADGILRRLDRIEIKLDRILEKNFPSKTN